MLHANELMIGDRVGYLPMWINEDGSIQSEGHPNNAIVCKVEMLGSSGAQLYNGEDYFDADDIELYPIPLTPEILEKNGFERTSDGWKCDESDVLTIAIHDGDSCDIWFAEAPFDRKHLTYVLPFSRSVHELQHALRLCGIEKEIEL